MNSLIKAPPGGQVKKLAEFAMLKKCVWNSLETVKMSLCTYEILLWERDSSTEWHMYGNAKKNQEAAAWFYLATSY